ncbi:hypothetical protein LTR97_011696 [Elasticomyces elasticus]|uniref:NADH:ubiquinone oxidoreductase intermediate-associated protein 30 domain-containing protein n=1 Tax=Elasticomyces elasticus TaxID=574655 RepID=A0AAN7ZYD6_9PEZI|nr:hypothetical protein LTR97_011696 [Elasticomyces elasticus]
MASAARKEKSLDLFGGSEKWNADIWTASDDSVRGGKSSSHLDISAADSTARFYGHLDIKTLGGAGFASQKTSGDWDLSKYVAIQLHVKKGDKSVLSITSAFQLLIPEQKAIYLYVQLTHKAKSHADMHKQGIVYGIHELWYCYCVWPARQQYTSLVGPGCYAMLILRLSRSHSEGQAIVAQSREWGGASHNILRKCM